MGLQVKRGTIQDTTFIEADQGSSKKPRGDGGKDTSQQRWNMGKER
jgi:IS5 family transposase